MPNVFLCSQPVGLRTVFQEKTLLFAYLQTYDKMVQMP